MSFFYDFQKINDGGPNPQMHIAGGHMHLWYGIFAYSVFLLEDEYIKLAEWIKETKDFSVINIKKNTFHLEPDGDEWNFFIDTGDSRMIVNLADKNSFWQYILDNKNKLINILCANGVVKVFCGE